MSEGNADILQQWLQNGHFYTIPNILNLAIRVLIISIINLRVKPKSKQSYEFQDKKIAKVSPQSSDNLGNR